MARPKKDRTGANFEHAATALAAGQRLPPGSTKAFDGKLKLKLVPPSNHWSASGVAATGVWFPTGLAIVYANVVLATPPRPSFVLQVIVQPPAVVGVPVISRLAVLKPNFRSGRLPP
ncbi:MAG: hypothetical protein ACOYXU_02000 [Nitrospirota bacterium]